DVAWLRYQHLNRATGSPELITDLIGYNTGSPKHFDVPQAWVGDLILECEATTGSTGQLILELCPGVDRFPARWDLATGVCTLLRITDKGEEVLDSKPTALKGGTHRLRFANVDQRLTVWVDSSLPFGDGVAYRASEERGPTRNDLQPAGIGTQFAAVR